MSKEQAATQQHDIMDRTDRSSVPVFGRATGLSKAEKHSWASPGQPGIFEWIDKQMLRIDGGDGMNSMDKHMSRQQAVDSLKGICREIGCSGVSPTMCNEAPHLCKIIRKLNHPEREAQGGVAAVRVWNEQGCPARVEQEPT